MEKKPEDNASTEDVRPTSGDAYDEATVSAHSQTLDVLKQIVETLEREREESRNREDRLNRQIKDLSGKLQHLTTQVEKQAKIINEDWSAAQDRETRMKNKVQDLEKIVRELSGSVGDVLNIQAKALRENKENSTKIAQQLNDLKELSTPHTKNDTSAVPQKPTTKPREGAKSTNQKVEDERKRKSGPSRPEKKQRGRADFEPRQRTSSWPDESDKTREPWADESEVVQHLGTQPTQKMNGWTQFEDKNEWRQIQFTNQQRSHWENSLVCPEFDVGPSTSKESIPNAAQKTCKIFVKTCAHWWDVAWCHLVEPEPDAPTLKLMRPRWRPSDQSSGRKTFTHVTGVSVNAMGNRPRTRTINNGIPKNGIPEYPQFHPQSISPSLQTPKSSSISPTTHIQTLMPANQQ